MDDRILKLENQLCFPLYAAAKEVVARYRPFLEEIDLTYTQYIAMMVLWDVKTISVGELGRYLYLDSGTLTPLLKRLESKGFVQRARSGADERLVSITITAAGEALKEQAAQVPMKMAGCIALEQKDAMDLYRLLYKLLDGLCKGGAQ